MENVRDIINSTKGPYPAFEKKLLLSDLMSIAKEVFEEDDDWKVVWCCMDAIF